VPRLKMLARTRSLSIEGEEIASFWADMDQVLKRKYSSIF
jgi:hypothetical protein